MEAAALAQDWRRAEVFARAYTTRNPFDPAGHFYLGFRYLHSDQPWFGVALGEYKVALRLFEEQGRVNPIARFESAEIFEAMCHLEISKVHQRQILFLMDAGAPRETFPPLLERWQAAVDRVRAINPDSRDVAVYDRLIQEFYNHLERMPVNQAPVRIRPFDTT